MSKNETGLQYAMIKNTSVVESVKDWIIDQLIKADGGGAVREYGGQPQQCARGCQAA